MEDINEKAMEILMLAGDARLLMDSAFKSAKNNDEKNYKMQMEDAKKKLVEGHRIQTKVIQETITIVDFITPLLFIHAQDTLMVVNSEHITLQRILELHKFEKKEENK